jgi:hypothetical protein
VGIKIDFTGVGLRFEVIDEHTAIEAQELVERGNIVSYSDKWRFVSRVSDPDKLVKLLEHGLMEDCFPIWVEVVK